MQSSELNRNDIIMWFDDLGTGNEEFRFLSNFYRGEPLTLPGVTWEGLWSASVPGYDGATAPRGGEGLTGPVEFVTGEHAFAAMKFWGSDWTHFLDIVSESDPNGAKALGRSRKHPLREDWEIVKLDVMAAVIRAKFTLDREEGPRLTDTGEKLLVEGTWWHDEVWGVDLTADGLPGRNWLGTLLMARRAELRAEQHYATLLTGHFLRSTGIHNSEFTL